MKSDPNFLFIGGARCGTTSIYHFLKTHPEAFVPFIKEVNYFSDLFDEMSLDKYKTEYFNVDTDYKILTEISPKYLYSLKSPERILKSLGNINFGLILRDPVTRCWSQYIGRKKIGNEKRSFSEIVENEINFHQNNNFFYDENNCNYLSRGMYSYYIKNYMKFFSIKNFKIFFYDDLDSNPNFFFHNLCSQLGISLIDYPDTHVKFNSSFVDYHFLLLKKILWNKNISMRFLREVLKTFIPRVYRPRIVDFIERINIKNTYSLSMNAKDRDMLIEFFKPHNKDLEILLGLKLPNTWYK